MTTAKTSSIAWLGHAGFRVEGSRIIYFDPWEVSGPPADLIFITHDHYDHCDPPTIKALCGPATRLITEPAAAALLRRAGFDSANLTVLEPGDSLELAGVGIEAVPAYNLDKNFHPRAKNYLGFVITLDGRSFYHAGDTDFIEEMKNIRAQTAFLPVSGTFVMTAAEAARAALALAPEVAVPMHYGKIVGDEEMARQFAEALKGRVAVEIQPLPGGSK
jgi:L-ascorbate metabolism protein UlaG (beta-lactamase superfamily)